MPTTKKAAPKAAPKLDVSKMSLIDLKKRRFPFLAERQKNRDLKSGTLPEVEEMCNKNLRTLNIEIHHRENDIPGVLS